MSIIESVAILGATGSLGRALIPVLIEAGFKVTAVTRSDNLRVPDLHKDVAIENAHYDDVASLTRALRGQDALIEAFNPSAVPNQRNIAEAAVAADVKHILTPDFSTDTFNPHVSELLIYDGKKKAQDELETVVKDSEGKLSWTAIIVGAWYDWAIDTGAFWINKNDRTIMRFGTGDQKYTMSKLPHVADFVVHVLRNPEEFSNRPAYFASNTITTNQLIDIVKGIGEKEWKIIDIDFSGFLETGRQLWAKDTEIGVEMRNTTQAWALLGTIVLFNEENRYGADYEEKLEPGWDQGLDALARDLRALLTKA